MTISIKDVARAAGVSPASVSRVLGSGPASAELRRLVEAAVQQTGYRPNLSARRLRSRHSQTVGLIVADIRNPFFTMVARAVEDAAYRAGLRVILCNTDEDPDREAMYLRLMQEERVTGVIFAPTRAGATPLPEPADAFPIVMIDRVAGGDRHDAVVLDNHGAMRMLVEHLHGAGYRRITGLFGNTSMTGRERHEGYAAGMRARNLVPDARFIVPSMAAAEAEVAALLASPAPCEAVIVSNGVSLLGAAKAILASGRRIPEDLALAGFDNEAWTALVGPGLTVVEQPVEEIGATAMRLLLDRLDHPHQAYRKVSLSGTLIVRPSTQARSPIPARPSES